MKVLQINSAVSTGSVGRIVEDVGNMLIGKGVESHIATSSRVTKPSKSHLVVIGNQFDVALHGLKSRLFDAHAFGSKKATEQFIEKVKVINPDVIHLSNLHGYYINIEVLFNYLSEAKKPVVWTFHDCWPFTGHCAYFDRYNCYKWKEQCYDCPGIKGYPASFGYDNSRNNYNRKKELFNSVDKMVLVGVCNWIGNFLQESFLKKYPVKIIYNGIDTDVFKPRNNSDELKKKLGISNEKIVLGAANVWSERKGLLDFIEFSKKLPENVKIILIGLSAEQQKDLPSNIIGINRTDSIEELADLYSLADVFANPTYVDNFPTTNIESLSTGTPVITYRTGGSPEAVDADTGIVIEKGDKDNFLKAILEVINKGKISYSDKCRERALKHFDKRINNESYYDVYKNILQN